MPIEIRRAPVADCDPVLLYRLLRLRVQVFVVEQGAAYDELDGRDIEPGAELMWVDEDGEPLATLRLLRESAADGSPVLRIGRVATSAAARGRGVASDLMRAAVARCEELAPGAPILLGAQAHLADWYARFGFAVAGDPYTEDDIPHLPMARSGG
ncbi:GNAT family N-acetyltransferase [Tersicoccus solisilvae]|uniref:GNAT family N-acetyltransferase n=1 Tax=Tersicoccus solisilvae TaxID=1882339 RepID=UPI001E4C7D11|nr:GNAT family N-acetyltransferase [Tersicoccus solisilvae]